MSKTVQTTLVLAILCIGAHRDSASAKKKRGNKNVIVRVNGGSLGDFKELLQKMSGVNVDTISLADNQASIAYDPDRVSFYQITTAARTQGFTLTVVKRK